MTLCDWIKLLGLLTDISLGCFKVKRWRDKSEYVSCYKIMIIDIILMRVSEITSRSFCKSKTKIQSEGAKQLNVSPLHYSK